MQVAKQIEKLKIKGPATAQWWECLPSSFLFLWHYKERHYYVHLQDTTRRIENNSTYDANTGPIFKKLELLKFHDIHLFQLGFFLFSFKNSTLPSMFNNLFYMNSQIHNNNYYNTMNAHSFCLPLCRTNTRKFSNYLFPRPKVLQFFEVCHNWFVLICSFQKKA